MHTIEEINARLAAIAQELDAASGEAFTALEREAQQLLAERTQLENEAQSRQALRSRIASGAQPGVSVMQPAAAPAAPAETVEQQEERAFIDYIYGRVAEMRSGDSVPQNFNLGNNGAVIPVSVSRRIIETVKEICPILREADLYAVNGTLKIPVYGPVEDENGNEHNITVAYSADFSELTADAGAFTTVDLGGYLIGALTLIGKSLQNNAGFNVLDFVIRKMAEEIAAFAEGECLNGTGSTYGHCTGALSTTNTINAGSTSAITADNLIDLQACVPQAYQGNAHWTVNSKTLAVLRKLKDGSGQYLLQTNPGLVGGFPYVLLGKPVYVSDNMPLIASAARPVLYGEYSGLSVNIRENISVEVLREKYATQHALGVVAYMEMDSKVSNPQKLAALVMSA